MANWPVILQTLSAVVGASTFLYGVGAWRRSIIGQKRIDLAVQTIVAFKEAEQAYSEIRSPVSSSNEGSSRQPRSGESEQDAAVGRQAFVAIERINNRTDKFVALSTLKNLHQAYFGSDRAEPFEQMLRFRFDITRAALRLENHWRRQGGHFRTDQEFQEHLAKMHEAEELFWEDYGEPDPIKPRISAIVSEMENFCREIIDPSPTLKTLVKRAVASQRRFWLG